jgi:hypothetical protein
MLTSRAHRLSLLTLVAAALAAASLAPTASAATQRYASPGGGGDCSAASPCSLTYAVNGASAGDEVIVNPGTYLLTGGTLGTPAQITIHGVAGEPRPRLMFSGFGQLGLHAQFGSTLRHLEIHQAAATHALYTHSSTVDQVVAKGTQAGVPTAVIQNGTIRNTIVVASGTGARAIRTEAYGGPNTSTYRNVTAVATGTGGVAIEAYASLGRNATIDATNVIARGGPGGHGFVARTDGSGAIAKITAAHSNWSDWSLVGINAIFDKKGLANQTSAPSFVNSATGEYRQAAGSVTIGAGLDDASNGALDVDGDPRAIGTTDIGADEFVVAPGAVTGPASAVGAQSAALSGSVDPKGAPTSYHFEYGPTTAYGSASTTIGAGSGTGLVAIAATLGGLSPATTYHYRVVAINSGGVTKGADQAFTTTSPPPTAPPPVTPPQSTPPQSTPPPVGSFAGVRLVSTKLTTAGRFITLKLSCPAATVGRCTGQTKLTTRRRRSGTGAAATVGLGRARFSIAAGKQARVRLRVSRAGRRLLGRTSRLRGRATSAARDSASRSITTVAKVSIRRRQR